MSKNWPALNVGLKRVDELVPYARNSRTHTEAQVAQIAAAMQEWGWTIPVLIDECGTILAGHCRIMAARVLGLTEVPAMVASGWSAAQKRAYVIADNKLALNAGWDPELLRLELSDLAGDGFKMDLLGFPEAELADIAAEPDFEPIGLEDQSRLDERKRVRCPECGHEFEPG